MKLLASLLLLGTASGDTTYSKDKPKCHTTYDTIYDTEYDIHYEKECSTTYEKDCKTVYDTIYDTAYDKKCTTVQVPVCETFYDTQFQQKCETTFESECETLYREAFQTEYKSECTIIIEEKCVKVNTDKNDDDYGNEEYFKKRTFKLPSLRGNSNDRTHDHGDDEDDHDNKCDCPDDKDEEDARGGYFLSRIFFGKEKEDCRKKKIHDKQCTDVPFQFPVDEPYEECSDVPKEHCHDHPVQIPREECHEEPEERCHEVPIKIPKRIPRQFCRDHPRTLCRSRPIKVPKKVARKVSREHCTQHTHSYSKSQSHSHGKPQTHFGHGYNKPLPNYNNHRLGTGASETLPEVDTANSQIDQDVEGIHTQRASFQYATQQDAQYATPQNTQYVTPQNDQYAMPQDTKANIDEYAFGYKEPRGQATQTGYYFVQRDPPGTVEVAFQAQEAPVETGNQETDAKQPIQSLPVNLATSFRFAPVVGKPGDGTYEDSNSAYAFVSHTRVDDDKARLLYADKTTKVKPGQTSLTNQEQEPSETELRLVYKET